jgi:hypothetical protein
VIVFDAERIGPWVCERTGGRYEPSTSAAVAMEEDGVITAGVLYDMFNGRSICMHVAIEKPVSRRFTRICFDYPFNQLKVHKVMGLVDSTNSKALRFDKLLGFVEEARIEGAGKTGDLVILTMTRQQCRWIKEASHGR